MVTIHRVLAGARADAAPIEFDFERGLRACYRHFGVGEAVFTLSPAQRPTVTHIVVRDDGGDVVGGARIHRARPAQPLPALRALRQAPALRAALIGDRGDVLVELASLWVRRDAALRGVGRLIGQASVAAAAVDGASRAVTFSHLTIAGMLQAIGMRPTPLAEPIGYPNPSYQSTVWELDPSRPDHAHPADREQIAAIRTRWTDDPSASIRVESTPAAPLRWSVVAPARPKTTHEHHEHHVQPNPPRFARVSPALHPGIDPSPRRDG